MLCHGPRHGRTTDRGHRRILRPRPGVVPPLAHRPPSRWRTSVRADSPWRRTATQWRREPRCSSRSMRWACICRREPATLPARSLARRAAHSHRHAARPDCRAVRGCPGRGHPQEPRRCRLRRSATASFRDALLALRARPKAGTVVVLDQLATAAPDSGRREATGQDIAGSRPLSGPAADLARRQTGRQTREDALLGGSDGLGATSRRRAARTPSIDLRRSSSWCRAVWHPGRQRRPGCRSIVFPCRRARLRLRPGPQRRRREARRQILAYLRRPYCRFTLPLGISGSPSSAASGPRLRGFRPANCSLRRARRNLPAPRGRPGLWRQPLSLIVPATGSPPPPASAASPNSTGDSCFRHKRWLLAFRGSAVSARAP